MKPQLLKASGRQSLNSEFGVVVGYTFLRFLSLCTLLLFSLFYSRWPFSANKKTNKKTLNVELHCRTPARLVYDFSASQPSTQASHNFAAHVAFNEGVGVSMATVDGTGEQQLHRKSVFISIHLHLHIALSLCMFNISI